MSARKKSKIDKAKQQQKIIHSAIKIFSKKGYTKTTIEEIAKNAKIAKGLVYYYFKTKEEIYLESLNSIRSQMKAYVDKYTEKEQNAFEKIRVRTKKILEFFSNKQDLFIVFAYQDQVKKLSEKQKKKAIENFFKQISELTDYFKIAKEEKLIISNADPESLSLMLFAQVNIFMSYAILKKQKMDPEKIFKQIDKYFLQSLKSTGK
ncbi:TetR/AcrR family transcriptional regulator [Candidatus Dependentiae bacterium]|nr:TetR/AcrR family transcriptional regulator [Candidatus Dependentiae bacterium]